MNILSALLDPAVLIGGSGGSGALAFVVAKFHRQDREIRECRERDARVVVIEAGFRMVVGEMQRTNPNSQALAMCSDLLNRKLGPAQVSTVDDFSDLLRKLDDVPATGSVKK